MWVKARQHCTFRYRKFSRYRYRGVLADKNIISDIDGQVSFAYQDSQSQSRKVRTLPTVQFLGLLCSRECCNMYTQRLTPSAGFLQQKSGLLRGHAKKLKLRIQLMLAVAGAQFQVTESPIIAEVKRRLATRRCPCCQQAMRFMGVVKRTSNLIPAT